MVWGAQVNYARQVLRHVAAAHGAGLAAVISEDERRVRALSWPELKRQSAALALHLQAQGVQPGDRVAAYPPNMPETMVAFLACASIGRVWSVCAPDMGTSAVPGPPAPDRAQVLIAVDGVTWVGRGHRPHPGAGPSCAELPSLRHLLLVNNLDAAKP